METFPGIEAAKPGSSPRAYLRILDNLRHMTVLVGCGGWSYDDWAGRFYPVDLAKKKGEWLAFYARFFETAEI